MLGNRGLNRPLGQRTDRDFSVRLVLPHRMVIVESADVLHRGLGGPQARETREAILQTRDVAFYFLVPEAPSVPAVACLQLTPVTDPGPRFRRRGAEPPPTGTEPGGRRRASRGRGRVRSWGRPRPGEVQPAAVGLWFEPQPSLQLDARGSSWRVLGSLSQERLGLRGLGDHQGAARAPSPVLH